jgi:hypothetical protein
VASQQPSLVQRASQLHAVGWKRAHEAGLRIISNEYLHWLNIL